MATPQVSSQGTKSRMNSTRSSNPQHFLVLPIFQNSCFLCNTNACFWINRYSHNIYPIFLIKMNNENYKITFTSWISSFWNQTLFWILYKALFNAHHLKVCLNRVGKIFSCLFFLKKRPVLANIRYCRNFFIKHWFLWFLYNENPWN